MERLLLHCLVAELAEFQLIEFKRLLSVLGSAPETVLASGINLGHKNTNHGLLVYGTVNLGKFQKLVVANLSR